MSLLVSQSGCCQYWGVVPVLVLCAVLDAVVGAVLQCEPRPVRGAGPYYHHNMEALKRQNTGANKSAVLWKESWFWSSSVSSSTLFKTEDDVTNETVDCDVTNVFIIKCFHCLYVWLMMQFKQDQYPIVRGTGRGGASALNVWSCWQNMRSSSDSWYRCFICDVITIWWQGAGAVGETLLRIKPAVLAPPTSSHSSQIFKSFSWLDFELISGSL